jgi:hypothetical protein
MHAVCWTNQAMAHAFVGPACWAGIRQGRGQFLHTGAAGTPPQSVSQEGAGVSQCTSADASAASTHHGAAAAAAALLSMTQGEARQGTARGERKVRAAEQ